VSVRVSRVSGVSTVRVKVSVRVRSGFCVYRSACVRQRDLCEWSVLFGWTVSLCQYRRHGRVSFKVRVRSRFEIRVRCPMIDVIHRLSPIRRYSRGGDSGGATVQTAHNSSP